MNNNNNNKKVSFQKQREQNWMCTKSAFGAFTY